MRVLNNDEIGRVGGAGDLADIHQWLADPVVPVNPVYPLPFFYPLLPFFPFLRPY